MAVTTKMSVDVSGFKRGIAEASASVKTLDAALKKNEAQYKATGNAEEYLSKKADVLKQKLQSQKNLANSAANALAEMNKKGISPASTEYQKMAQNLLNAEAAMIETQNALDGLSTSQLEAADSAEKLTNSVNGISKKVSFDQVISGISAVRSGLESAAKKAVDLGETIFSAVMDKAAWADDTATMALMYGIDLDKFLRMQKLVTNGMDTSVDAILKSQKKLNKGMADANTRKAIRELGVMTEALEDTGNGVLEFVSRNPEEIFWEVGQALMGMSDAFDKEAVAQKVFGRSWEELVPLFTEYKSLDEYNKALNSVTVSSEEDVNALAELNDKISELKGNLDQLSTDILAQLAPALSQGADALNGVLSSILEYLRTDAGKEQLQKLGDAIGGLFADLSKIDPQGVVEGFTKVFTAVTGGIQWLVDNESTAKGILGAIVAGWGALTIGENVLKVFNFIDGIRGLGNGAASAGAAAGASWGAAFANAVAAAAPWLIGLYTLMNPADTINNDLASAGDMTAEGWMDFYQQRQRFELTGEKGRWFELIQEAGEIVDSAANLWTDTEGIRALSRYANGGNKEQLAKDLQALGYVLRLTDEALKPEYNLNGGPAIEGEGRVIPMSEYKKRHNGDSVLMNAEELEEFLSEPANIPVEPAPVATWNNDLLNQVGTFTIPVNFAVAGMEGITKAAMSSFLSGIGFHANGLPSVPYDGYLAMLHRGERVMTASENRHYTYNNNTYFGNVNLNNGMDIDNLVHSIDRNNRRKNAGYGG